MADGFANILGTYTFRMPGSGRYAFGMMMRTILRLPTATPGSLLRLGLLALLLAGIFSCSKAAEVEATTEEAGGAKADVAAAETGSAAENSDIDHETDTPAAETDGADAGADAAEPETMTLLKVDDETYLGIVPKNLARVPGIQDFAVVIDLRYPYEGVYDELGALQTLGIKYINLPSSSHAPEQRTVEAFQAAMKAHAGEKILVHDSNGYRTAMIWAAYRLSLGGNLEDALAEVQPLVGEHPDLKPALEGYAASLKVASRD